MAKVRVIKAKTGGMITKRAGSDETSYQEDPQALQAGVEGLLPSPYPIDQLQLMIEQSTILGQCVLAYKRNIVGFGADIKYQEADAKETPEMKKEWDFLVGFKKYFNFDQSFEDIFGIAIEDREITGNGYLEILRNTLNQVDGAERLDPKYMKISVLSEPVQVKYIRDGKVFKRTKRFRKYCQDLGTKKIWFKEFGDPRPMDSTTGQYVKPDDELLEANEVLHLKLGSGAYGIPRWIGQLIHMYGARMAEELNYSYFMQGRHTPMAIMLSNGALSAESVAALEEYAAGVQGVENAHKFLVIESESNSDPLVDDKTQAAKVEIKSLAEMLQQDALFLEYDDASREKVQSAFGLPDIYVGRSKDFNRATADTARQITEEQVFDPERASLEFIINTKLLADYNLQHAKYEFKKPEIGDSADLANMIKVLGELGAYSPNDLREIAGDTIGKELEPFDGEEFDKPKGAVQAAPNPNAPDAAGSKPAPGAPKAKPVVKAEDIFGALLDVRDAVEELGVGGTG